MPSDTFYILDFPIDQLSEHVLVVEKAIQLILAALPCAIHYLHKRYDHILELTQKILHRVISLTKSLCVDILNSALFGALCNSRTCEKHPSPISQEGLVHIGEV